MGTGSAIEIAVKRGQWEGEVSSSAGVASEDLRVKCCGTSE